MVRCLPVRVLQAVCMSGRHVVGRCESSRCDEILEVVQGQLDCICGHEGDRIRRSEGLLVSTDSRVIRRERIQKGEMDEEEDGGSPETEGA